MVNIVVWTANRVSIERQDYDINSAEDMVTFLLALMDKIHYSGESTCLETATIDIKNGKANYTEINRWSSVPTP